jgi:hypothetical protein
VVIACNACCCSTALACIAFLSFLQNPGLLHVISAMHCTATHPHLLPLLPLLLLLLLLPPR